MEVASRCHALSVRTQSIMIHKRHITSYSVLVAILMYWLANIVSASDAEIIKFISSETPPFWSKSLSFDGMCGEMLHEISREIGVEAVITYQPTTRMIESEDSNLLGNPEFFLAKHDFEVVIPIAINRLALFYYKPHHNVEIKHKRLLDLKGYTIGIMKGSLSRADISYFERSGINFEESYTKESLFKKLKLGRIDLCIEVELSGLLIIDRLFHEEANDFSRLEIQRSITPIAVMIKDNYPNSKLLGKKINQGLDKIIKDGKYIEILEKYYGKNNVPRDWYKLLRNFRNMYDFYIAPRKVR